MISESVPKSSITVDTAFQRDLTLQGCTTLPTRADWLLAPYVTHFPWCAGRGWSTKTFPLLRLNHEFTKRGKLHRNGSSPKVGPPNCESRLVYQRPHLKQPWPCLKQSLNTQIRWLMEQTRKVGVEGVPINPRVVVRSVLVQEAWTRVLGSARMSQTTTSHVVAHPNLLACLNTYSHHTTSSCHTIFICSSDSLTICTRVNN
jgi:hypothetical protein